MKYKVFTLKNFRKIPQLKNLSSQQLHNIETVAQVYPFRVNNYVLDELIDWSNIPKDPMFQLTFPQKDMLSTEDFESLSKQLKAQSSVDTTLVNKIRLQMNPHPAGQESNVPTLNGEKLSGLQHKYKQTVLFFPTQGQTCHAYCSFCFRWPQFVGMNKFAMREVQQLIQYVKNHPEITDILFTGGDPLVMKTRVLAQYVQAILDAKIPHLKTLRFGSKSLSFWPYRFLTDDDADDLLNLFKKIKAQGLHLAFMAHFNHPAELKTPAVKKAIERILETKATIRTQSPLLANINNDADTWAELWQQQTQLGCIPYYMFLSRDTGAQHYFAVPLVEAWDIFQKARQKLSGVARTAKGPSMSATEGKVQILGVNEIHGKKVFVLQFLQGRNPDWVMKPFFAEYDANAVWLDELKPFENESFFFEKQAA